MSHPLLAINRARRRLGAWAPALRIARPPAPPTAPAIALCSHSARAGHDPKVDTHGQDSFVPAIMYMDSLGGSKKEAEAVAAHIRKCDATRVGA